MTQPTEAHCWVLEASVRLAQSWGPWMQASLVIIVTGKLGLVVPSWGTPLPGAYAQHPASKAWFSLSKDSGPNFPGPHLTNTPV